MNILWFRRDLRLNDNESVFLSTANNAAVLPCFIIDPWFYQKWADIGKAWVRFLFESLENLDANLQKLGSRLYLFEGEAETVIKELTTLLISQDQKPKLFFNRDVQVEYGIERDQAIINFYKSLNLDFHIGLSNFIQADDNHRDEWFNQYYTYQRQSVYPEPNQINTPQLSNNVYNLNPQIINGLYNLEQRNFFREGREQLDREIKELYEQSRSKPGKVLQLNPEIKQIQRQLAPLELPQ